MIQKNCFRLFNNFIKRKFSTVYVNHTETFENNKDTPFEFNKQNYLEIEKILSKYPSNYKKSGVISLLFIAQKQNNNFLTLSAMKKVAQILEIPEMDVFEVASFYSMFNREKIGKYHLQFCGTTPCMLCGSREIIKAAENYLGAKLGETTKDGLFTLQEVECLGACVNAPMLQVNNEYVYEDLTPETMIQFLKDLQNGKEPKKGPQTNRNMSEGPLGRTSLKNLKPERKYDRDFLKEKQIWEKEKEKLKK